MKLGRPPTIRLNEGNVKMLLRLNMVLLAVALAAGGALLPSPASPSEMSYVVKVNGEPVSSYDVAQRQKLMALTSGALGKRMRGLLQSESTQQKFQQFIQERRPTSREEAQALQKEFVERLQSEVMADIGKQTRKDAIEELIEERLMMQEAARQKVSVSEADVDQRLAAMAKSGNAERSLNEFLESFRQQGVQPETLKQRIRAQLVWRDVIRKIYGFRIASLVGTSDETPQAPQERVQDAEFDVRRLRIATAEGGSTGQAVVARAYLRGETLRKQFASCGALPDLARRAGDATVETFSKKKASFFPRDARPLLIKASEGQMLPPILTPQGVDLYAVCAKRVPKSETSDDAQQLSGDRRQEEFQVYARRHLTDLRQDALIERR